MLGGHRCWQGIVGDRGVDDVIIIIPSFDIIIERTFSLVLWRYRWYGGTHGKEDTVVVRLLAHEDGVDDDYDHNEVDDVVASVCIVAAIVILTILVAQSTPH